MNTHQQNILLITRRKPTICTLQAYFEAEGTDDNLTPYRVVTRPDLTAAESGIKAREYHLVLLDNGPGECFKQPLKELSDAGVRLPVIVLADSFDEETTLLALSLGAHECVPLEGLKRAGLSRALQRALVRQQAEIANNQGDIFLAEAINAIPHPLYIIDVQDYRVRIGNQAAGYTRARLA